MRVRVRVRVRARVRVRVRVRVRARVRVCVRACVRACVSVSPSGPPEPSALARLPGLHAFQGLMPWPVTLQRRLRPVTHQWYPRPVTVYASVALPG